MPLILSPKEVQKRFGRMFSRGFFTLVDEKHGIAQVVEHCTAKGPVEWDALNRMRAGGVVKEVFVDGNTLIMNTMIGEGDVRFGPSSKSLGGQALKALKVVGDEVHTTWLGLAGASLGVGACLAQAPGVIQAIYPNLHDLGGANEVEITIVTKKMKRLIIGIDDTDSKEKGASWVLMLELMNSMPYAKPLQHKIIQLNPEVPEKTTSCVSIAASFAVKDDDIERALDFAVDFLKERSFSKHTSMAVFEGLRIPEQVKAYGFEAKSRIFTLEKAERIAKEHGIGMMEVTGRRGMIGALAAIGCFDSGLKAAGLKEDFL